MKDIFFLQNIEKPDKPLRDIPFLMDGENENGGEKMISKGSFLSTSEQSGILTAVWEKMFCSSLVSICHRQIFHKGPCHTTFTLQHTNVGGIKE